MTEFRVIFPDDYDDLIEFEFESKGYLPAHLVDKLGQQFSVTFFEPMRLAQDISSEMDHFGWASYSKIIVVPSVTRSNIEVVVARITSSSDLFE